MKIQYRNTFHDVAAFNVHATLRSPQTLLMNTVHVLTFLFVAMPLWKFSADNHSTIARLIACALLAAIVVALFFLLYFVLSMLLLIKRPQPKTPSSPSKTIPIDRDAPNALRSAP